MLVQPRGLHLGRHGRWGQRDEEEGSVRPLAGHVQALRGAYSLESEEIGSSNIGVFKNLRVTKLGDKKKVSSYFVGS